MKAVFWGVRGSLPAPHSPSELDRRIEEIAQAVSAAQLKSRDAVPDFLKSLGHHRLGGYGGNTPCVEVRHGLTSIIIDAGSGIRNLGYDLLKGPCGVGQGEVHIFMTHFHWDHLIGLPFFTPLFIPGNRIHFHAVQPDLRKVVETIFSKPFFPVPFTDLSAKIEFHALAPRQNVVIGDLSITPYMLDHPDPCWGYRVVGGDRVYAHCVDTECRRVTREALGEDLPLYQGVNLMAFDAQYTLLETIEKVNWGHAAAGLGLDIALREEIDRVLFMHHDPASSDEKIATVEAQTKRYFDLVTKQMHETGEKVPAVKWEFAREGSILDV